MSYICFPVSQCAVEISLLGPLSCFFSKGLTPFFSSWFSAFLFLILAAACFCFKVTIAYILVSYACTCIDPHLLPNNAELDGNIEYF